MRHIKHTLLAISITANLSACSFLHDVVTPEEKLPINKDNNVEVINLSSGKQNNEQVESNTVETAENNQTTITSNGSILDPLNSSASFTTKYRHLLKENQLRKDQILLIEQHKAEVKQSQVEHENQDINFYVRLLMQDLVDNLQSVNKETPVAVTDFVMLDSDLNTTTLLGHQIAESLTHEIHKFGIPVIDYKATGYIRVTEDGDFFLTRNYEEISSDLPIQYIFTGVLTKHQRGYLVNAKVVDVQTKALVGTAQSFIPEHVSRALLPSQKTVIELQKNETSLIRG